MRDNPLNDHDIVSSEKYLKNNTNSFELQTGTHHKVLKSLKSLETFVPMETVVPMDIPTVQSCSSNQLLNTRFLL